MQKTLKSAGIGAGFSSQLGGAMPNRQCLQGRLAEFFHRLGSCFAVFGGHTPRKYAVLAWLATSAAGLNSSAMAENQQPAAQAEQSVEKTPAKDEKLQRRVRELIYMLRNHRVFERCNEWAGAIRELILIGSDALPELLRELETTDRDATLRALGFTLRGIGDARAVPYLIRAIPKTLRRPGSDCGVVVSDPELMGFMLQFDRSPGEQRHFSYGRPVNEILDALQTLAGHVEPPGGAEQDQLRHIFLRGTEAEQTEQRRQFQARQEAWQKWWSENWRLFVTEDERDPPKFAPRKDLVERAGIDKFGPLFPTGPDVRLGPVQDVKLQSANFWDGKSHIDFDTGRVFEYLERDRNRDRIENPDDARQIMAWYQENGIDARCFGQIEGRDLHVWLIDDGRWDTIDEEVRRDAPLELGREATSYLAPFGKTPTDFDWTKGGTFLFTTREGGRGIVRTFPDKQNSPTRRLQYRMFLNERNKPAASIEDAREVPGDPFGEAKKITLPAPGEKAEYLFDLETEQAYRLPVGTRPEPPGKSPVVETDPALVKWRREQGLDLAVHVSSGLIGFAGGEPPPPRKNLLQIVGLDLRLLQVSPAAFDKLSVGRARGILERPLGKQGPLSWMDPWPEDPLGPHTWVFKTREGSVGLLQIVEPVTEPGSIAFRYRLSK